jgi:hypothetical protein
MNVYLTFRHSGIFPNIPKVKVPKIVMVKVRKPGRGRDDKALALSYIFSSCLAFVNLSAKILSAVPEKTLHAGVKR